MQELHPECCFLALLQAALLILWVIPAGACLPLR